ncbi:MAG: TetR/AcrR family transcriptional regulator [Syntrophaceae bacterium]
MKRLRSEQRKQQLVNITLDLIASQGLQGTSMGKVAKAAGITEMALYRHFRSRRELIQAALDEMITITNRFLESKEPDIKKRLRTISAAMYDSMMSDRMEPRLLFEFLRAPVKEQLKDQMQAQFQAMLLNIEALLEEGIHAGQFHPDIDKTRIAWEIFAFGFTLNFVNVLGFENNFTKQRALTSLDEILNKISA